MEKKRIETSQGSSYRGLGAFVRRIDYKYLARSERKNVHRSSSSSSFFSLRLAGKKSSPACFSHAWPECRKRDPWIIVFAAGRMDGRGHKSLERDFIERNWIAANRRGCFQTFPPRQKLNGGQKSRLSCTRSIVHPLS